VIEPARKRVVVLLSGRGSNMEALYRATLDPTYPASIVAVFSDRDDAGGLQFASRHGLVSKAFARRGFGDKAAHEAALIAAIDDARPDIVCLAGYMRLLSGEFVRRYAGRMINIHPSLLPLFAGLNTHQRALDAGVRIHGCSVHFVTEGMDEGPIIAQAAVPVLAADDAATLAARVLGAEHALYPQALAMLARGSVSMGLDGRSAFAPAKAIETGAMLLSPSA
jgi:phosphoribosylglycinamide formyltransferase 1